MAHTSRGKDFVEYDNPYNVGMTGIIGQPAGYHAVLDCDVLLLLGADFAWSQFYPNKAKIIQIDADPTHIGRRTRSRSARSAISRRPWRRCCPGSSSMRTTCFLTSYVERHRKDRAAADAETVSGPDATIPGDVPRQGYQQARGPRMRCSRSTTALCWSGRFAISIRGGKRRTFGSLCTARWRAPCLRRLDCKSASQGDRSSVSQAMAASPCCSAT